MNPRASTPPSAPLPLPAHRLSGDGAPIVFIQGVGMPGAAWSPQTDTLAATCRCLVFDHRGVGDSASLPAEMVSVDGMARDTLALMDARGWESAHLVGHSLGGLVALHVALCARSRVRSLALLCTFANGRAAGANLRMVWIGARTRIGTERMRRHAFLEIVYPRHFLAGHDRDQLASELATLFGRDLAHTPPIVDHQLRAMRKCNVEARLHELAGLPTLVVSGALDPIAPPSLGERIANRIPGARFVCLADSAHGIPIHQAGRTNNLLAGHLGVSGVTNAAATGYVSRSDPERS